MKQVILYAIFWLFSATLKASDEKSMSLSKTFSKSHVASVTQTESVRLKEIDVANPLFITR